MKKARKITIKHSPSPPSFQLAVEESRSRMKLRSLMLDYEDLLKETEAKRKRLQAAKKNKQDLLAQVKFLRRKYKTLTANPTENIPYQTDYESQQAGPSTQSPLQYEKIPSQPRTHGVIKTGPKIEPARKSKVINKQKDGAASRIPAAFDLNQSAFHPPSKHHFLQSSSPAREDHPPWKGDLNQAAVPTPEELEYGSAWEAQAWDRPGKKHHAVEVHDADNCGATGDVALAVCRNHGKTASRNGKRKISWQDHVALRV